MNNTTADGAPEQSDESHMKHMAVSSAFIAATGSPLLAGFALWRGGDEAAVVMFAIVTILLSGASIMLLAFANRLHLYAALVALVSVASAIWSIRLSSL